MKTYVLRRFLQMIPLLFGISALTFILLQLAPGDFLRGVSADDGRGGYEAAARSSVDAIQPILLAKADRLDEAVDVLYWLDGLVTQL